MLKKLFFVKPYVNKSISITKHYCFANPDMDSEFVVRYRKELDQMFADGIVQESILIGHGDWIPDPVYQDTWIDRSHQLTQVQQKIDKHKRENCQKQIFLNM